MKVGLRKLRWIMIWGAALGVLSGLLPGCRDEPEIIQAPVEEDTEPPIACFTVPYTGPLMDRLIEMSLGFLFLGWKSLSISHRRAIT